MGGLYYTPGNQGSIVPLLRQLQYALPSGPWDCVRVAPPLSLTWPGYVWVAEFYHIGKYF